MAEGGTPVVATKPPVDNAKMLGELKLRLMHTKKGLLAIRGELQRRAEIWGAAQEEITALEKMASDAKERIQKQSDQKREERKLAAQKRKELKQKQKEEKKEESKDEKDGADDEKNDEN